MAEKKIIKDWMKTKVFSIQPGANIKEAVRLMLEKKIGTLPVVDENSSCSVCCSLKDYLNPPLIQRL